MRRAWLYCLELGCTLELVVLQQGRGLLQLKQLTQGRRLLQLTLLVAQLPSLFLPLMGLVSVLTLIKLRQSRLFVVLVHMLPAGSLLWRVISPRSSFLGVSPILCDLWILTNIWGP